MADEYPSDASAASPDAGRRDHHATIFVPRDAARDAEAARRRWDPVMADRIAAHVTLAYPEEAPNLDLLVERLREAGQRHAPFRLGLARLACYERPERGVYVEVEDVEGGYRRLRADVLRPPFSPLAFPPHVTVVHPRTSLRGREYWEDAAPRPWRRQEFTVMELTLTAFDGVRWTVVDRFALQARGSSERGAEGGTS